MNKTFLNILYCILAINFTSNALAASVSVFSTDFNGALAAEISPGTATLTGVQGFAGLGPTGNQFGGNFLRSETGNIVSLNLTNLPTHDTISLKFLFAAIDSLDGTGTFPQGDFFKVVFDGNTLFSESFANAQSSQIQSYTPPANVELARHQDLGFTPGSGSNSFYSDSAYNLGADPVFSDFAHTGTSALIQLFIFGPGNQDLNDESWAMDNLEVSVFTKGDISPVPVPPAILLFGSSILGFLGFKKSKKTLIV